MNIIEAVKSGKPFRRKSRIEKDGRDYYWYANLNIEDYFYDKRGRTTLYLSPSDMLADDWEVEEESITLTMTECKEAFLRAGYSLMSFNNLAKALGFDDV